MQPSTEGGVTRIVALPSTSIAKVQCNRQQETDRFHITTQHWTWLQQQELGSNFPFYILMCHQSGGDKLGDPVANVGKDGNTPNPRADL